MSTPVKYDVNYSKSGNSGGQHSHTTRRDAGDHVIQAPVYSVDNSVNTDNLVIVMQRQNDITENLIRQQKLSTLPPQNIPVFKGDPIEYRLFMRAFEHSVESKTENSKDRLYYLEQHTIGPPNDLVRSCFHMDSEQGYPEAKRLLKERFGDKYKISMAYLDKALNWPIIKSEDSRALESYALFLTSCSNAMADLEYLDEMENAANMRTIIAKLPYRLRERFRSVAIDIQKRQDRRTKFKDVVTFITMQAEMASHPVFGEIPGQTRRQTDSKTEKTGGKKNITTLATEVKAQKAEKGVWDGNKKTQEKGTNVDKAFNKPCIFCQGDHTMEQCRKLQKMLHKEKLEFLKGKGLCFSCLMAGHMSKACEEKKSCQICSATHPTLLHIKQKTKDSPKEEASTEEPKDESTRVVSGFVDAGDTSSQTGAGGTDSILAIVPVRVKAKRGNKVLTCYAFLDPGSNASFCTNKLANDLHLQGKNVNILLTTMGEQKAVSCKAVPDLEVSSLEGDDFIGLTEVFAQKVIPVSKENIPTQDDVDKWPHLQGVRIPSINADVGLLIGTDVAKALEPQEVIRSIKDGPYAVRTALGWTVNGPLRENIGSRTKHGCPQIKINRISVARLEELWAQQFKCDFPENAQSEHLEMSKEDQLFMDRVSESAKLVNGHYSIGLPLKNNDVKMPNNRAVAEQQALNMKKKLQRNQTFKEDYINTRLNPADYASRGQRVSVFVQNEVWISGPAFLSKPEGEWPDKRVQLEELTVADPEVKKGILVNATTVEESTDVMQQLTEYFSSWIRLKKAVAWLIRVKGTLVNLSKKTKEINELYKDQEQVNKEMTRYKKSLKQTYLTLDDLRQAERDIIRHCQQRKFQEEISALQRKELVKKSSRICRLNPQLQEGILRVAGRLSRASMPAEAKHPMLLPKDHRVADLILQDAHERLGHSGRNHVLSHVRQRYWIIDAPSSLRKMLSRCTTCRRQHGASGTQMMADLPRNRVVPDEPPFTRSGVDLFGPFNVKRGRSHVKRYGVIFTCLASRAVHIEMATSLETDSFIHALRRFIARRGQVKEMRSDNGTNFVGADRELRKAIKEWNTSQIENSLLQRDIKWIFNPPSRSHHGGVWERIIRSIRKIMVATLREQSLDEEGLQTFFCECEAILNSRPITTPSNDMNDLEALTPQHLLLLKTQPDSSRQMTIMRAENGGKSTPSRNFIPGDVVLIVDESAPRGSWLMGRIVKTMEDEHGMVRKVRVKTKTNELERPITKLCLLQEEA
ncbi:hypothetical protein N1851_020135 [Merluccius polli]|uniref:Integrase catalytic domain-containing protein n=1 Tax=Merluccius polli TaxID=89951 RepID=A0AA47MKU0_MERPO|nr:hypothetical protein N1851_020135 [Merluccius polli]